jgi:hypothetical protein
MAYGVKYELFFSDVVKRKMKIEILEKDYTGDVSSIIGTGQPAVIEWDADDDIYSPIIGSRCKLSFFVTDSVQYDEFYRSDERQYKVKILYYNSYGGNWEDEVGIWDGMDVIWNADIGQEFYYQPIWEGFLVVDRYQEAVVTAPYEIQLEAIDGLGTLEGFDAPINTSDTSNTESLFYYLKEILKLTGHQFDLYVANSIRKATSPPADQTIFHDIIINEYGLFNKNLTLRTAKDVLEIILKITNSRIFQSYGRWYIVSNSNLIDNRIDTSGVIDVEAPSGDDDTDDPNEPNPDPVYGSPSITITGETTMYEGTSYFLNVLNSGTTPVSYEWTLPDSSTVTQTSPQLAIGVVAAENNGDIYSVIATDANNNTDTDTFTLTVEATRPNIDPDPPEGETTDTNYAFVINVVNSVTGAYVSPLKGTIDYAAGEVGDSFTMIFNVVSLTGEFTSVSQLTGATLTSGSGTYNVETALVGDFIRVTVTGNLPSGGGTETLTLTGASDVQQFTTTFTRAGTVSNASYSLNPADLSATGGTGKPYSMTITYTAASGYEWTGLGNIQILSSADVGQQITTQITNATTLVVTITGTLGIANQAATLTINGAAIYANPATTISISPSARFDFTPGGGYFDITILSVDGAFTVVTSFDWFEVDTTFGAPDTTTIRVYVDPNNTPNARIGTVVFYPTGSLSALTTLRFDQASNLQAG